MASLSMMRRSLTPITWFIILTLIAVGVALGLPPDPHAVSQLHTSETAYRLAVAALLIPYILIWYAGFYAFAKLLEYSKPILDTKEGVAFHKLTIGMGALAFSLVVPTIIMLILNNIAVHYPAFHTAAVIISNYLNLFPEMIAFLLLYNGSRELVRTLRSSLVKMDLRWHAPLFLLLVVTFTYLTIQNQSEVHPYYLSIPVLIVTFILPYVYGWMLGLLGAYNLWLYAKAVRGVLYRQAVRQFANGLLATILGSVAFQFLSNTIAQRIQNSLGALLLADYGLLIILAVGLVLMALGTKKLKMIEGL